MRAFLIQLLLIALPNVVIAQGIIPTVLVRDNENDIWHYEKVIDVENTVQKEIYDRVKLWVLNTVKTGDVNSSFDDKNMETIITTPSLSVPDLKWQHTQVHLLNFKLKIEIKDNKIRVSAKSFVYYYISAVAGGSSVSGPLETVKVPIFTKKDYKQTAENIDHVFSTFVADLEKEVRAKKSDW